MIPIQAQPEPAGFNAAVRKPGRAFLAACPFPQGNDWTRREFWRKCQDDLYKAYHGICAYTCEYIPRTTANVSIDHFRPKSAYPNLAYEWGNYRLASQKVNSYKANYDNLTDPFTIAPGWFTLEFPACLVRPGRRLSAQDAAAAQKTINILRLNKDDLYVQSRCDIIIEYINGEVTLEYLRKYRPFIATEIDRQRLSVSKLKNLFKV